MVTAKQFWIKDDPQTRGAERPAQPRHEAQVLRPRADEMDVLRHEAPGAQPPRDRPRRGGRSAVVVGRVDPHQLGEDAAGERLIRRETVGGLRE